MEWAITKTKKVKESTSESSKGQRQSVFYSYAAKRDYAWGSSDQVVTVCLTGMGKIWARGISIQSTSDEHNESEGRKWAKARATAIYKRFMSASSSISRDEGRLAAFPIRRSSAVRAIDYGNINLELGIYYSKGVCPADLSAEEKKLIAPTLAAAERRQDRKNAKPKKTPKPDPLCKGCAVLCEILSENRSRCSLWKNKDPRCRGFLREM